MTNFRNDITQEMRVSISNQLKTGASMRSLTIRYNCSFTLIRAIKEDRHLERPVPKKRIKKICSACKVRSVKRGFKFLCDLCYKNNDDFTEYY